MAKIKLTSGIEIDTSDRYRFLCAFDKIEDRDIWIPTMERAKGAGRYVNPFDEGKYLRPIKRKVEP